MNQSIGTPRSARDRIIGTTVAVALWLSPFLYRVLDPFIVVLNAGPKIALVPIFYI